MNATATEIRLLPLAVLVLSGTEAQEERRGRFDQAALKELARSLATTGQINPIVVRHHPKDVRKFEIVAGERRFVAAGIAGLESIMCSVRALTDEQVLEVQIIENLQREDLHELAEAEAYEKLVSMGRTPAQIASQVHKDESYVRKRMRLLSLCAKGRKAFYAGDISVAIAIIIARIPVEKLQEEALAWYLEESTYENVKAEQVRAFVQARFMTDLSSAPFDVADSGLVAGCPPCAICPKNTLAQRALFDDIKGKAHCTDNVCFQGKRMAHGQRLLEKARAGGQEVITGKEAKKIAPNGGRVGLVGYFDMAGHAWGQPVKKLLKGVDPKALKLLQLPDTGEVIEVAPKRLVDAAQPKGSARETRALGDVSDWKAEQRERQRKRQAEQDARRAIFLAINSRPVRDADGLLRQGILAFWSCCSAETKQAMRKAYGWTVKSGGQHFDLEPFMPKEASGLLPMLRALTLGQELTFYEYGGSKVPKALHAAAAAYGVDVKKIRAELVKAKAPKKKGAKAPARKK